MPSPPRERWVEVSTWVNISNSRGSMSAAMPSPVSRTRTMKSLSLGLRRQRDTAALRRVFRRVRQQVHEDLLQPRRVPVDHHGSAGEGEGQLVLAFPDQRRDRVDRVADDGREVQGPPS